jgi:hypothetical protein
MIIKEVDHLAIKYNFEVNKIGVVTNPPFFYLKLEILRQADILCKKI